jgi:aryl-alcohol dehydrogenase-like predicted oxidoreductase
VQVLRRAVELGVDHIDTAQYYGPGVANELTRAALHPYPDNLALVSKVGARRDQAGGWLSGSDPDQLRAGIEDNLRGLGAGQLAAVNLRVLGDEPDRRSGGQLAAMIQAREDGLIGGVGLSSITLETLRGHIRARRAHRPGGGQDRPGHPGTRLIRGRTYVPDRPRRGRRCRLCGPPVPGDPRRR